ncbi:zinc finger protein 2 homolog isoform X2 [Cephus cinctus]|uniref:Zinc finger protein 2 homolog isoform X2 n=1 Tax=Cephus cinctus TaxID=211228 RepID=A0AAJ7BHG5_CEPCN|nr:zinc finger protein 2 homolog isoform X2 [Cephus cinctus]
MNKPLFRWRLLSLLESKCSNIMSTCSAQGCNSNQNTKINGRNIHFFPFPTDVSLKEQWEYESNLLHEKDCEKYNLQLCELHFDKSNFTEDNIINPNAVPTIFEFPKKRKYDNAPIQHILSEVKEPVIKQIKLAEDTHSLVTPPHSPSAQLIPAINGKVKVESTTVKRAPLDNEQCAFKQIGVSTSLFTKQIDIGKKVYRLTIRIDKTRARPCPKSKKMNMTPQPENKIQEKIQKTNESHSNDRLTIQRDNKSRQNSSCDIAGCKLQKTLLNKKPVFKCECCARYYIVKRSTGQNEKNKSCFVCHFVFPTRQALCLHIRKHFTCDMCGTECGTQISFNKHARQHVSTDPTLPYKCHKCLEIFETKSDVRQHNFLIHSAVKLENKTDMDKKPINLIHFQQRYRRLEFTCDLCQKTFQSSKLLDAHRAGHIGTLKFTCRVCCKEFDNVEDVDMHTKIHLEVVKEEHKCNICKKLFKTDSLLNEHLRGHLSRAHHCPICPKAFINRTTLRIHLKTHSEDSDRKDDLKNIKTERGKTYCCTLCREEFNTYSNMYSHIMTHLEKMHEDGSKTNIDDLADILDIEDS